MESGDSKNVMHQQKERTCLNQKHYHYVNGWKDLENKVKKYGFHIREKEAWPKIGKLV